MSKKYITVINKIGGQISHRKAQGRDYLVAPMVAVVSKVLNGMYLPPEEIEASILGWPGVPLTHTHPNGSARDPDVTILGRAYNPTFEDNALKTEAWFDMELTRLHGEAGEEIIARLEAGETIEVSTGYYAAMEWSDGTFDNEQYFAIQRDLKPDHIAVLPHDIGACSIDDGCGVPRRNENSEQPIFHFDVKNGQINLEDDMKKSALLGVLNGLLKIFNLDPIDEAEVEGLDDEVPAEELEAVLPADASEANEDAESEDDEDGEDADEDEGEEEVQQTASTGIPPALRKLAALVEEVGESTVVNAIRSFAEDEKNERAVLLADLVKCANCKFTRAELESMSTNMLKKLALSVGENGDYSGRQETNRTRNNEAAIPAPPVFLATNSEKES